MRQAAEAMARGEFIVARDLARRVTEGAPEFVDGWMMLTEALAELGQFESGLDTIDQAITLHPGVVALQVQKCKFLMGLARRDACLEQVQALRHRKDLDPWALDMLGLFLSMLDRVSEAADVYEQLSEREPDNPENHVNLGMARMALGNLEQARQHAERALELAPGFSRALALIANLRIATREDNNLEPIRAALGNARSLPERVSLGYAHGKELDDLGRWDEAFCALRDAGLAKRQMVPYDQQRIDQVIAALMEQQDAGFCAGSDDACMSDRPIFIFGMPRSGTTLVERILGAHEDVVPGGELRDFMDGVNLAIGRPPGQLLDAAGVAASAELDPARLGERYLESVSARVGQQKRFTDKLPLNFLYLGLIARALPDAGLVHVKRNPMDIIFSNFKILFADLNAYSYTLKDTATYYVGYERLMRHWERAMPGRIHTIVYEELVSDTESSVRELLSHCGLPWQEQCLQPHRGRSAVTTASAVQVRRPVYGSSVGHWRNYQHLLGDALKVLDEAGIDYR
jgi:tetratricopeptide (TPR) repeat protein